MKKFELMKEYPGSPKLGTEIILGKVWSECGSFYVPKEFNFENYPEYWKKIVKEELSVPYGTKFQTIFDKTIYTIQLYSDEFCLVEWLDNYSGKIENVKYEIKNVNSYIKEKAWVVYKEFSFECEDGKVDNQDQWVYFVTERFAVHVCFAKNAKHKVENDYKPNHKYFTTEKAAKNYVKHNKPVLSMKEVYDLYLDVYPCSELKLEFKDKLNKLTKSKLQ
jgi:hypothetical protein